MGLDKNERKNGKRLLSNIMTLLFCLSPWNTHFSLVLRSELFDKAFPVLMLSFSETGSVGEGGWPVREPGKPVSSRPQWGHQAPRSRVDVLCSLGNCQRVPYSVSKMRAPGLTSHVKSFASQDVSYFWWLHASWVSCDFKDKLFSNLSFPCKMIKLRCVTGVWGNTIF